MLRRFLPVAAAAAALVAVPSIASATAPQAPVENMFAAGYTGSADLVLPEGQHVTASLTEFRGASRDGWSGNLSLTQTVDPCPEDGACVMSYSWGNATLTEAQVNFSRNLDGAAVADVPLTLYTVASSSIDDLADPTSHEVTVSIRFSGTGDVTRSSNKGDMCGFGSGVCQSHWLTADRDALVDFALDGQGASGPGHLSYFLSTETAIPKFAPPAP